MNTNELWEKLSEFDNNEYMSKILPTYKQESLDLNDKKVPFIDLMSYEEQLKDEITNLSFKAAIEMNKELFQDKVVLDLNCGMGIFSFFAINAGAKEVYSIENEDVVYYLDEIVKLNGLDNKIKIIRGNAKEIKLPVDKVDIIISQWMGYNLLYGGLIDDVIYARDKWLIEGGLILPDKAILNIAAISDENFFKNKINFWDDIGNKINMECLKLPILRHITISEIKKDKIISTISRIYEINLYKVKIKDLDFSSVYELVITSDNYLLNGFVVWFDVFFQENLNQSICFTTGPFNKLTQWKQSLIYLEQRLQLKIENKGEIIKGSIAVRKSEENPCNLDVKISIHHPKLQQLANSESLSFYQVLKLR